MDELATRVLSAGCITHAAASDELVAVAAGSAVVTFTPRLNRAGMLPAPPGAPLRRIAVHRRRPYALVDGAVLFADGEWREFPLGAKVHDFAIWRDQLVAITNAGVRTLYLGDGARRTRTVDIGGRFESVHAAGDGVLLTGPRCVAVLGGAARGVEYVTEQFPMPVGGVVHGTDLTVADHLDGVVHLAGALSDSPQEARFARVVAPYAITSTADGGWIALAEGGALTNGRSTGDAVPGLLSAGLLTCNGRVVAYGPTHLSEPGTQMPARRLPGFAWDVSSRRGTVAWATGAGVGVRRQGDDREVRIDGGARAVQVGDDRVWAAAPSGLWSIGGDRAELVAEADGTEPVALGFDERSGNLLVTSGTRIASFDPEASRRPGVIAELRVYPQRLVLLDGEIWAACGDGGVMRSSMANPERWLGETDIEYVSDVGATHSTVAYATSNGILLRDRPTNRVRRHLYRPDTVSVAITPDGTVVSAAGRVLHGLDGCVNPVLPFAPRRLACDGSAVFAAGAGGVIEICSR